MLENTGGHKSVLQRHTLANTVYSNDSHKYTVDTKVSADAIRPLDKETKLLGKQRNYLEDIQQYSEDT